MIRLSPTGKILYRLLSLTVVLLLLLMIAIWLGDWQALPVPTVFPDSLMSFKSLSIRLFDALILTGFVTGGVMLFHTDVNATYLLWAVRVWTVMLLLGVLISSAVLSVGLLAFLGLSYMQTTPSRILTVWKIGIMLTIVALPIQVLSGNSAVSGLLLTHVAYGVTAVSITFWLITRWSNVRAEWVQDGIVSVSGAVALAGLAISMSQVAIIPLYGLIAGVVILPCYTILAGHHYRALRDRTPDMSLSPHWVAMATVFWLGVGFFGVGASQAGVRGLMAGAKFGDVQVELVRWVMVLIVLSLVNYTATYLRGDNRRVTGYMPLWLIGFGLGLTMIIRLCGGIVDIYLREFFSLSDGVINGLLLPLTIAERVCWLGVTAGVIIYGLGFVARRPKIITA